MNNLSNERLRELSNQDKWVKCSHDDLQSIAGELLAYREAAKKPVGLFYEADPGNWYQQSIGDKAPKWTPLYAAPPLPVVPDAIPKVADGESFKYVKDGVKFSVGYANGWNAFRAAMLKGGNQ